LRDFNNVDLPHPEGPIIANKDLEGTEISILCKAFFPFFWFGYTFSIPIALMANSSLRSLALPSIFKRYLLMKILSFFEMVFVPLNLEPFT